MNEKSAKKLIDTVLDVSAKKFDGVEVTLAGSDVATSRFAESQMTQNQAPESHRLSVRVLKDGRQIRLETSDTGPAGIKAVLDNAFEAVKYSEPDPDLLSMISKESFPSASTPRTGRLDSRVKKLGGHERAAHIGNIIELGDAAGLTSAGVVASGTKFEAVGNSEGLFDYHQESHLECSVTMVGPDSSGWAKSQSPRQEDVDPRALGASAVAKAKAAANPRDIEPGRYAAILEHSAVLDLLSFLLWDFAATSHRDRQSCLLNKVGEQVFGENINIVDDVYHPLQAGSPFDAEGLSRQRINLVERGRLVDLVYGRRSARLAGRQDGGTGHSLPEPSIMGEYPMNPIMAGGDHSLDEMIASTNNGILLSRVWYVRTVDPARKILTGMTRDGTFKIEGGRIVHGVKNLRFNISLLELFNRVEMLSKSMRAAGEEGFPAVVPAIKVSEFNFTEVTRF